MFRLLKNLGGAKILRKAALILDHRGWTQGLTMDSEGRVDLVGALSLACGVPQQNLSADDLDLLSEAAAPRYSALLVELYEALSWQLGNDPTVWNDSPNRVQEDVTQAFSKLASNIELTV